MKNLFTFLICFMISGASVWAGQKVYNLKVTVKGIQIEQGNIRVALYDKNENFLTEKRVQEKALKAQKGEVEFIFNQLEPKVYAISLFQDINRNDKLDRNFLGIPTEPYGFSQNASNAFGPPSFKQASFTLDKDQHIEIDLH